MLNDETGRNKRCGRELDKSWYVLRETRVLLAVPADHPHHVIPVDSVVLAARFAQPQECSHILGKLDTTCKELVLVKNFHKACPFRDYMFPGG